MGGCKAVAGVLFTGALLQEGKRKEELLSFFLGLKEG
jgi:hypothetical protein